MTGPPPEIVNSDGSPNFGLWRGDIHDVNPVNYRKSLLFDTVRHFREKRWQYIGFYGRECIMGLAVVHTGYLGNAFCYVFDKQNGTLIEIELKSPLGLGVEFTRSVSDGVSSFVSGKQTIAIRNAVSKGERRITLSLTKGKDILHFDGLLSDDMCSTEPLQVVTPTSDGDFTFTHKSAGLPITGELTWNDRRFVFDAAYDLGAIDYTFGFPSYHTVWRWASMAGFSAGGHRIGLNLVEPVFHPTFTENGVWFDGRLIKTSAAHFEFDRTNTLKEWVIRTEDGIVDLRFTPAGKRQQNIDLFLIRSRFQQPFGVFDGIITTGKGERIEIVSVPGVVEDHDAFW